MVSTRKRKSLERDTASHDESKVSKKASDDESKVSEKASAASDRKKAFAPTDSVPGSRAWASAARAGDMLCLTNEDGDVFPLCNVERIRQFEESPDGGWEYSLDVASGKQFRFFSKR